MITKNKRVNIKNAEGQYVPVSVDSLSEGKRLPFDIYIKDKSLIKPIFSEGMVFTAMSKAVLTERGISAVYVTVREAEFLDAYLAGKKPEKVSLLDDPAAFQKYTFYKDRHHQIDRSFLLPGTKIPFSLFTLHNLNFSPLIEASEDSPARIEEGLASEMGDIVIKRSDIPLYCKYLAELPASGAVSGAEKERARLAAARENAKAIVREIVEPPHEGGKAQGLKKKEEAKLLVRDFLSDPRQGEKIRELKASVNGMIDSLLESKDAIYHLLSRNGCDFYIYTHSVNVAALSIGLGAAAGLKRDALEKLGIGAMLHDVGKSAIAREILHRQGRLNEVEYKILQTHVAEGEKILRAHKEFPEEAFSAVLQHHEKLSGRGYPLKLSGNAIKPFGRITAIADCYDALITRRPYRPAQKPFDALSIIAKEAGDYDPEFLRPFIKMLSKIE